MEKSHDCDNMAFLYGMEPYTAPDPMSYWTPERKMMAELVLPYTEDEPMMAPAANALTTDPQPADLTAMPFNAGGKLYYTMDGTDYVASASIFKKKNLLLTAAHCIQNKITGNLGENYLFERCHGPETYAEQLTFKTVALKEQWYTEKKSKWDYSIVVLNQNSTVETPLQFSTVGLADKTVTAFGYPTNYYDGESMVYIEGTPVRGADSTWMIPGCKMRKGASGGAWVLQDGLTAVGVNAFISSPAAASYLGSPMFDENFEKLYEYVLTLLGEE